MEVREEIIARIRSDLIGPASKDERLPDRPSDVYLSGILYPQRSDVAQEEADQLQAEGSRDVDSNDVSQDEISLATVKRPASAGISFVVACSEGPPVINVEFTGGAYRKQMEGLSTASGPDREASGGAETEDRALWVRTPLTVHLNHVRLDFEARDFSDSDTGIEGLTLHVRTNQWEDKILATVAMVNANAPEPGTERDRYEEMCFFQTKLTITPGPATRFHARPLGGSAIDEDTRMAQLIYRDVVEYAVGHTCAADWREAAGSVSSVKTEWLPQSTVKALSSAGVVEFSPLGKAESGPVLDTYWLSESGGEVLCEGLRRVPDLYEKWLASQEREIRVLKESLQNQAVLHLERARKVSLRMKEAIDLLERDQSVQLAFRLANRAIMLQRNWAKPEERSLVWRPFQLGFILLALPSVAQEEHPDRGTVDLLWFPTGGGKTEAYLALIAFTLFLRRLRYGRAGLGVASLMRYTLRLLTVQQFQRAAALVCACDALRLGDGRPKDIDCDLGKTPFSLGLWVGSDSTPNSFEKAVEALGNENATSRPDQLKYCPKHRGSRLTWRAESTHKRVIASCSDSTCHWGSEAGSLPLWTVDSDIYRERPSLIIGTIDKFAQLARKPDTAALFGSDSSFRPPELIIQDELHLISGPLGTLAGLYEIAVDQLCSRDNVRPKVIASTATIRQASSQIRDLFDRDTCLFPPPILNATNSGFAVEDLSQPGRLYLGVTTAGRSAKFTLQAVAASLLQVATSSVVADEYRDDFWTLVTYFNSLRELGGALVLLQDDVRHSIEQYAKRHSETPRTLREPVELTSRVNSSEIKDILDELETPWNQPGCCDSLLASNMISVGVDVPRLGLMIVNGQPKGIAEYIQATSRVGRRLGGPGGIVLTAYNNAKARDRSHFETFRTWHEALYREVEATSVTPFAPRARKKALHATLVILARHLIPPLRTTAGRVVDHDSRLRELASIIARRAQDIDEEEFDNVSEHLAGFLDHWISNAGQFGFYWNDRAINKSLLISAEKAAEIRARSGVYSGRATPTPNSMRNVEPGTLFRLKEKLTS